MGEILQAEKYLLECLTFTKEIGFVRDIINLLYEFAGLRVAQNAPEQAVEILALVTQHPASEQAWWFQGHTGDNARALLAELEVKLSPESYKAALQRGQERELDELVADLINPTNCR
jgi:hypothetical protein